MTFLVEPKQINILGPGGGCNYTPESPNCGCDETFCSAADMP
jgi:hypothetical protein